MKLFYILFILSSMLISAGTNAGTKIYNQATLNYEMNNVEHNLSSNTVIDTVSQLIDVKLTLLDINITYVEPSSNDEYITYEVTNTGNGEDSFSLSTTQDITDDFDIDNIRFYSDDNNNSIFDVTDTLITSITLRPDESSTIFVVADIPSSTNPGDISNIEVLVKSDLGGSGTPGTLYSGEGIDSTDAIDGANGGRDISNGAFSIAAFDVIVRKGATITNRFGTNEPITGAIITYEINVSLSEEGVISDVNVTDDLEDDIIYKENSITLNSVALSDADDLDNASFSNNQVFVHIQELSAPQRITFEAYIK